MRAASATPARSRNAGLRYQRGKILRALAAFEAAPPDAAKTDLVAIGLACALGYLDWRQPVEWRSGHPRLVKWLAEFTKHEPAFERTRAPSLIRFSQCLSTPPTRPPQRPTG